VAEIAKEEMDKFVMLMISVLTNPQLTAEYIVNPRGVLNDNEISEPVKEVVLSGNMERIQQMFRDAGFSYEGKIIVRGP